MKKEAATIWKEKDPQLIGYQGYPKNHSLSDDQKEFYKAIYPIIELNKPRMSEVWDIYEFRDPYIRRALQIPLTASADDDDNKVSDILRKDFIDSRVYKNQYKPKAEDFSAPFIYDLEYGYNIEDVKKCEECGEVVTVYDEIRNERFCPTCGLVQEQFMPEIIQYKSYKGPVDEDNLGRNKDYPGPYNKKNWKAPRNNQHRPTYNNIDQSRFDRLMDTLITNSPKAWDTYEKKILKPKLKKEGFGSKSIAWWELRRRRPPSKKENETLEEKNERQKGERDKKRIQRLNDYFRIGDIYINDNELPKWVRSELKYILKQIPKKVTMTNVHSKLKAEKIIFGIILYIIIRAGELDHPILHKTTVLTTKEKDIIFNNLDKVLKNCKCLYDDSSTY